MGGVKTYTGTILLGKSTPSYDLESEFNAEFPTAHVTAEIMESARKTFVGKIEQIPPIFSAKQVNGQRAYDLARAGKEFELKANSIEVFDFTIRAERFPEIDFEISCSKGTYIRSIAHDFGTAVGSGGTLITLRRTRSGEQNIEEAKSVDDWIKLIRGNSELNP
jgi:tRNA pseudouridine55 synthase